jgi:nucleoside-diphosphate-sugar epimerase
MARVLVTGATGFIGSKLTQRLVERGDDVTCLVRASSKVDYLRQLGVCLALGDVRDDEAMRAAVKSVDVVYHVAGLTTAFSTKELMQVNAEALGKLLTACTDSAQPPIVLFVSSLSAAGPSAPDRPRAESDCPAPVSNYGRAKRAGEIIAEEFASHVPITIVRPPIVFGEGDLPMSHVFRTIARFNVHVAVGMAQYRYAMVHVWDLVDALILCAEKGSRLSPASEHRNGCGSSLGYYFVADNEQPTFADFGRMIGDSMGRHRVRVLSTPGPILFWTFAAMAEAAARLRGRPHIFNLDKARDALAGNWTCNSQAIRDELGFAPNATLAERLRQTTDWYRQQNLL